MAFRWTTSTGDCPSAWLMFAMQSVNSGDRAYFQNLGLSVQDTNNLLNQTAQFNMSFGRATELATERGIRANPFLSQHVIRGPATTPRGVAKPDWYMETPSRSIPVDLSTPTQLEKKLKMWRSQHPKGKAKWYVEKGLNPTYEVPRPGTGSVAPTAPGSVPPTAPGSVPPTAPGSVAPTAPGSVPPSATQEIPTAAQEIPAATQEIPTVTREIAQVAKSSSRFRAAGRFLAREAPGFVLQVALGFIFPPSVNVYNDNVEQLSRSKLDPAVQDALAKQADVVGNMLQEDLSQSIYANVTVSLDYSVRGDDRRPLDLELHLADVAFVDMKISNENLTLSDPKFSKTGSRHVTKQVTYSLILYESPDAAWARAQEEYRECLQRYGTGGIPSAAGAEASQRNPEEGACIPPHMRMMEGP